MVYYGTRHNAAANPAEEGKRTKRRGRPPVYDDGYQLRSTDTPHELPAESSNCFMAGDDQPPKLYRPSLKSGLPS